MTQEEKAKAYDEALRKIRPLYERAKKDDNPIWSTYEYLVPELAESEDKRIRKALIEGLKNIFSSGEDLVYFNGFTLADVLAYLEKQKEQKPAEWSEEDEIMIDKIEQFLSDPSLKKLVPNTKKQTLTWLKSLPGRFNLQPKQEWSEEDTLMLTTIIKTLELFEGRGTTGMQIDWLKSLRPRPSWKPSEEQMAALLTAVGDEKQTGSDVAEELRILYYDLKKLL